MRCVGQYLPRGAIALLFIFAVSSGISPASDDNLTADALVAYHLRSIGDHELLEKIQSRACIGTASVRFVQGATGELSGQGQFVSEGRKIGIVFRFNGQDYLGEHFAYDGRNATVGRFLPGRMSPLADFVNRFNGIMKEGLLGGVLSVGWPLRNLQETQPRLKCKKSRLEGQPIYELEYRPKKGLKDCKIVLFFESETYRHIRTEYRLHVRAAMGEGAATSIGVERPDSYYVLSEEFADFKEIEGMTLPQRYTIGFSCEGQMPTFLAYWTLAAEQWGQNGQIDPSIFKAPE
jgi:hypothetical protein